MTVQASGLDAAMIMFCLAIGWRAGRWFMDLMEFGAVLVIRAVMDRRDDAELNALADARANQREIPVSLDDLTAPEQTKRES